MTLKYPGYIGARKVSTVPPIGALGPARPKLERSDAMVDEACETALYRSRPGVGKVWPDSFPEVGTATVMEGKTLAGWAAPGASLVTDGSVFRPRLSPRAP